MIPLNALKLSKSEGFNRIPQRILVDGAEILAAPLGGLFERIYNQKKFLKKKWSVAKVIPIHKKGLKTDIESYRPIANVCPFSKVFENYSIFKSVGMLT